MPAVSKKQQRFFGYLLSNPEERKKKGISKKAAKDFAQDVKEVAPPGWGHTKAEKEKTKPDKPKSKIGGTAAAFKRALDDGRFKGLPGSKTKKEKTADMFKLMWSMKKKGDKPHYKPGTDEKKKKYQDESFEINPKAHKTAQKKAKIRNLARGNENPNEKAAAEKRLGPKLVGEGASIIQGGTSSKKVSYRGPTSEKSKPKKSVSFRGEKDERIPRKNKHGVENKSARYASQLHRLRPRSERVKEETTMKDNNLFGNAYAGSYKQLKKKIGSKKKHTKPAVEEGVDASYSQGQVTYSSFYNRAKEARKAMATKAAKKIEYDKKNDAVRADYKKHGIKFSDKKGTGRIVKGKKRYD